MRLRYPKLILQFFIFSLKSLMEYKINFITQSLYGPAYVLVMFLTLNIAFDRAGGLMGWTKQEGLLLFAVFNLLYLTGSILFLKGIRKFLWESLRTGDLDFILTKPINPQFMIAFGSPEVQLFFNWLIIFFYFIFQLLKIEIFPSIFQILGFIIMFVIGEMIFYFSVSSFASLGFRVTKAEQIIEFYDKVNDFSQYPTIIFPKSFQMIAFTLVPIGFYGYIQTLFLLNKGKIEYILFSLLLLLVLKILNQKMWKSGLKLYSSASS